VEEKSPKKAQRRRILIVTIVTMRRGSRQGRFIVKSAITFETYGREMLGYSSRPLCEDWREKRSGKDKDMSQSSLLQKDDGRGLYTRHPSIFYTKPKYRCSMSRRPLSCNSWRQHTTNAHQLGPQDKGPGVTGGLKHCRGNACRGARRLSSLSSHILLCTLLLWRQSRLYIP
jgi:hypothetical protein